MPINEPIRIISDLHLGHHSSTIESPEQLVPLLRGVSSVIFNGDSVEINFTKGREKGLQDAQMLSDECLKAGVEPYFINGNHDPDISILSHADLADGAVLVTHGDMLFHDISPWANQHAPALGRAHTQALSELDDEAFHDFEKRLHATKRASLALELSDVQLPRGPLAKIAFVLEELWPPWRPLHIIKIWIETPGQAVAMARVFRPRARLILLGHTHRAGIWKIGPRVIVNTGSFMPFAKRLVVDVTGNTASVKTVKVSGGKFGIGQEIAKFDATKLKPQEGY